MSPPLALKLYEPKSEVGELCPGQQPILINNVLLESHHTHVLTCFLWVLRCCNGAAECR